MKKFTKAAAALLAASMSVLPLASCAGKEKAPNTATDVQIYMWKSGYDVKFMEQIVADFNAKQDKYKATLEYTSEAATIINTLSVGSSNTYDLYFTMLNTSQYNKDFAALDEVLDYTVAGESMSIREKYYDYLLEGVKNADGTTNFLTYANGWCGIVYNADILEAVGWTEAPRTTDELDVLGTEILNNSALAAKGVKPWIFYNNDDNNGYLNYVAYEWEAQYDGLDYYKNNMMKLTDENGNSPSKAVMTKKDGRYQALKVLEKILTPTTAYKSSTGKQFATVQMDYMDGNAAFMVNGSWLLNESSGSQKNFLMMKTPVISSIVEKLENTSMSDSTLSEIVKQVDEGATSSDLCSQNDFNRIKEARNILYNNAAEHYVFVPEYSVAKEGSFEFLKYFYSDEALATYMNVTQLPNSAKLSDASKFDATALDAWHKQQFNLANELTAIYDTITKNKIYLSYSINQFASLAYGQRLIQADKNQRKSADQLWEEMIAIINKEWDKWAK